MLTSKYGRCSKPSTLITSSRVSRYGDRCIAHHLLILGGINQFRSYHLHLVSPIYAEHLREHLEVHRRFARMERYCLSYHSCGEFAGPKGDHSPDAIQRDMGFVVEDPGPYILGMPSECQNMIRIPSEVVVVDIDIK